jgi:tetrapyrrole methylase family protein / MazG family protein
VTARAQKPVSASPSRQSDSEKPIDRLLDLMRTLRSDKGCPWDREQNLQTLKQYLVEESYEVLDAIDSGNRSRLVDELGDLLLQVVFQAQICSEEGSFTFDDVANAISEKLIRRHPHVFGKVKVSGSAEVLKNWEKIKRTEKDGEPRSAVAGIPRHLPALHKAQQVQKKAARVGFDWEAVHQVIEKLDEEVGEVKQAMASKNSRHIREEIGDLLFAVVNLSRFLGHNAEEALDETVAKFIRRFQGIEKRLHALGRKMTDCRLDELDAIWNEIKTEESEVQRLKSRARRKRTRNA